MTLRISLAPGSLLPAGVTIEGDNTNLELCTLVIDPIVAHDLGGSKAKLAALRAAAAVDRKPWEDERSRLTDVLMKLTLVLSGLVESYDWLMQSPSPGSPTTAARASA